MKHFLVPTRRARPERNGVANPVRHGYSEAPKCRKRPPWLRRTGLFRPTSCLEQTSLVPKLQLGNAVLEAPASRLAKLRLAWMQEVEQRRSGCRELRPLGSQAGAWEPARN